MIVSKRMPQFKVILQVMLGQDHGEAETPGEDAETPGQRVQVREYNRCAGDLEIFELKVKEMMVDKKVPTMWIQVSKPYFWGF